MNKLFNSKELIQENLNKIINNYNSEIAGNVEAKITSFSWNGMLNDFLLEFTIGNTKLTFRVNSELCKEKGYNFNDMNVIDQFEKEIHYLKRAYYRGIYSKDYLPFVTW
ncbi:hypothetical protein EJP82_18110 [Paenibacillus anaericanus]|uniref:Uncharacterized protein n=1 Tax=Paenibacillus anaericanus TaxID=170367 RepID=A0A3S1C6T3_9BACL|nr:hypothetical protein EJP82_18110 [Paenibacillus anaericanus]